MARQGSRGVLARPLVQPFLFDLQTFGELFVYISSRIDGFHDLSDLTIHHFSRNDEVDGKLSDGMLAGHLPSCVPHNWDRDGIDSTKLSSTS
jgi:hypothetical protein